MEIQEQNPLVVFANREPYIHVHTERGIEIERPASGLVSALEPVLRRRGGLWVAHGSGSADMESSDSEGIIAVPPESPSYHLKRVWLSPAEKRAYYDGFSNEALWPLFHLAHRQPVFRKSDWESYLRVNERFSQSLEVASLSEGTAILVQDFHLALVPRLLRNRLEQANQPSRIGMVWHIPWVPSEVFRICPWASEILTGMLGADLISFHTQTYCNSFLESCERLLESRVDYDRHSVTLRGHETRVRACPIGIDPVAVAPHSREELWKHLHDQFGISPEILGIGIDRLDYTKGIPERFQAIERYLEHHPSMVGRFCFLQIASPSRTDVPAYQQLSRDVHLEVERINRRFEDRASEACPPIRLVTIQQDWARVGMLYQAADLCLVSSLHDGMNLVAKEYVWSRSDASGVLILSRFAGASQELKEALLVNPYDIDAMAEALRSAVMMDPAEKAERMLRMRERVTQRTAQVWANEILQSLAA